MEIIAKILKNDYLTGIRIFEKGDALSSEEIVEAVNKAAEAAENDGFRGTYVDLPEKYLEMYGVSAFDCPIVNFGEYIIGQTEAEKKGFHEACCGDCYSYESGTCCKWGGTCNPNDVEFDCVHGDEIYTIIVDRDTDEEERLMYCIPESMSNADVAEELNIAEDRLYIEGPSGNERDH